MPYLVLILVYIAVYRDVVFYPHLKVGIDWPIPFNSPMVPLRWLYANWNLMGLGSSYQAYASGSIYGSLLYAFLWLASIGNRIVWQKLFFAGTLVASFTMYICVRRHLTESRVAALIVAVIYAYGPATTWNYGSGIIWEYAFFPLVMNYILHVLRPNVRWKDSVLLAILLTIMSAFGLHLLFFVPFIMLIFLLLNSLTSDSKASHLLNGLKYLVFAFAIFFLINPNMYVIALNLLGLEWLSPYGLFPIPNVSSEWFFVTFPYYLPPNSFTLTNWLNGSILPEAAYILVAVMAISLFLTNLLDISIIPESNSILVVLFAKPRTLVSNTTLGLWIVYVLVILLPIIVVYTPDIFIQLYGAFPILGINRGAEGLQFLFAFLRAALMGAAVGAILKRFSKGSLKTRRYIKSGLLASLLLLSFFIYQPTFLDSVHPKYDYPVIYDSLHPWLGQMNEPGQFRYILAPAPYTSMLYLPWEYPNQFYAAGSRTSADYIRYTGLRMTKNTTDWSYLLSLGNVKYMIVLDNKTQPPLPWVSSYLDGHPRLLSLELGYALIGDPKFYLNMGARASMKQLVSNPNFTVFENIDALPRVSLFNHLTYVVGDMDAMPLLTKLPGFSSNRTLLYMGDDVLGGRMDLLNQSNTVIFYNSNFDDLLLTFFTQKYGVPLYKYAEKNVDLCYTQWVRRNPKDIYPMLSHFYQLDALSYGKDVVENWALAASTHASMKIPLNLASGGRYEVWLRAYSFREAVGNLTGSIDGAPLNIPSFATESPIGFKWHKLGTYNLQPGAHTITLTNSHRYNALDMINVIPQAELEKTTSEISATISKKTVLYLGDPAWMFRKVIPTSHTTSTTIAKSTTWKVVAPKDDFQRYAATVYAPEPGFYRVAFASTATFKDIGTVRKAVHDAWLQVGSGTSIYDFIGSEQYFQYFRAHRELVNRIGSVDYQTLLNLNFNPIRLFPTPPDSTTSTTSGSRVSIANMKASVGQSTSLFYRIRGSEWFESDGLRLDGGYEKIVLSLPEEVTPELLIVTNAGSIADIFAGGTGLGQKGVSFERLGESEYKIDVPASLVSPVFISLSESYDPKWQAYNGARELNHFPAFRYANGFVLDGRGSNVGIRYEGRGFQIASWLAIAVFGFCLIAVGINSTTIGKKLLRRNRKHSQIEFA